MTPTPSLTVDDPLAGDAVAVQITVFPDPGPREERPVLVSVGLPGRVPAFASGTFAQIPDLLGAAWKAVGARVAAAATPAPPVSAATTPETETVVAEEPVGDATTPASATPRPQASNLTLF